MKFLSFCAKIKYWVLYKVAWFEFKIAFLCGKIGEWFLWQEWKHCTDREEFEKDIRRLRGIDNRQDR